MFLAAKRQKKEKADARRRYHENKEKRIAAIEAARMTQREKADRQNKLEQALTTFREDVARVSRSASASFECFKQFSAASEAAAVPHA